MLNIEFELKIQRVDQTGFLYVKSPFSILVNIKKNKGSGLNIATFKVFNLGGETRDAIRRDLNWVNLPQPLLEFSAGKKESFHTLYRGQVMSAWSTIEGNDFVTYITCNDVGTSSAITGRNYRAGTKKNQIVLDLISDLKNKNVTMGTVQTTAGTLERGLAIGGDTESLLKELTSGKFFIENMQGHVIYDAKKVRAQNYLVDASKTLVGYPQYQQGIISFDHLFEPRFQLGQSIQLKSKQVQEFNCTAEIISIEHTGMISETNSSNIVTKVACIEIR